jgi:hypothetical protein
MNKIILPLHYHYGEVFGIAKTLSGTYVCPGWHPVPEGTTREQIQFDPSLPVWCPPDVNPSQHIKPKEEPKVEEFKTWVVEGSKPGTKYTVVNNKGKWSCTCPASQFRRHSDCKHIAGKKAEKNVEKVA